MILKLDMSSVQLAALHTCLGDPNNYWEDHWHREKAPERKSYVWIKNVKGGANEKEPIPCYEVVLEVDTSYRSRKHGNKLVLTPLDHLTRVLHAVGLFPVEDGQPAM